MLLATPEGQTITKGQVTLALICSLCMSSAATVKVPAFVYTFQFDIAHIPPFFSVLFEFDFT